MKQTILDFNNLIFIFIILEIVNVKLVFNPQFFFA